MSKIKDKTYRLNVSTPSSKDDVILALEGEMFKPALDIALSSYIDVDVARAMMYADWSINDMIAIVREISNNTRVESEAISCIIYFLRNKFNSEQLAFFLRDLARNPNLGKEDLEMMVNIDDPHLQHIIDQYQK